MSTHPLQKLTEFNQSIWLDFTRRDLLISGQLEELIERDKVKGMTSNPSIFQKAFDNGEIYESAIRAKALQELDAEEMYKQLVVEDIQFATDLFRPVFDETNGRDGYVSLEVSPHLAHDTQGSIKQARELWKRVDRPNLFIKIPGTKEGIPAIKQLISEGININITLLFGLERYREVTEAYLSGLEQRVEAGQPINQIASVASFFLSRIDVLVDPMLEEYMDGGGEEASLAEQMHGQVAIASAKKAYQIYKEVFGSDRFKKLADAGATTQRVLWASTSTKNPDYSDVKYVEALIGPDTVNTVPMKTLEAYHDHGNPGYRLEDDLDKVNQVLDNLPKLDIDLKEVTQQLEDEGVEKFNKPYDKLMNILEEQKKKTLSLPINKMQTDLGALESKVQERLNSMEGYHFNKRIWNKDPLLWKDDEASKQMIPESMGWLDVAAKMARVVSQLQHFARKIREEGFTHVVHMGMGGSSLAPLLFERAFETAEDGLELTVLDTTDPATIRNIEQQVPLDQTLFIVASKSGTTAEPKAFGDYFYDKMQTTEGDNAGSHFVVITDPETPLVDKAKERNYRRIFLNFDDIGGRYSALSYFGMVPAVLKGLDIGVLLERALRMQHACRTADDPAKNPALKLAAIMGELALQQRDKLTLVLPDELSTLGMWLEQLVAESTGKEGNGILPVAGEAVLDPSGYENDRLFVHLRLKGEGQPGLTEKLDALKEAGHPLVSIEIDSKQDIAQEFYRWEMAVAAAGAVIGINTFNQPNVQGSKDATKRLLKQVEEQGALPGREPDQREDNLRFFAPEQSAGEAGGLLQSFLRQSRRRDYIAIQAYLTEEPKTQELLQKLRTNLQQQLKLATTIGYGPRFLHSTGQFHKGGPNTGLFLQLTADEAEELDVPGTGYTFGTFIRAQAEGDLEALQDEDRRVIRIDLNSTIHEGLKKLNEWATQIDLSTIKK